MTFEEAQARKYDQWYTTPLGRWVDQCEQAALLSLLPPLKGLRVLDAGCGTGIFSLMLASRGARVVGVDRSAAMLARALCKTPSPPGTAVWLRGDVTALPLASESVDGVLAGLSLDFIAARREALQELVRVLRPGGFLAVAALNRYSLWSLKRRLREWGKPAFWRGVDFLSASELARLLRQTGSLEQPAWRRAVYCPPFDAPGIVGRGPLWERLGAWLLPWSAAFLVAVAKKRPHPRSRSSAE